MEVTRDRGSTTSSPPPSWWCRRSWRSRAGSTSATCSRWGSGCSSGSRCCPGSALGRMARLVGGRACCSAGSSSPGRTTRVLWGLAFGAYASSSSTAMRCDHWSRPFLARGRRRPPARARHARLQPPRHRGRAGVPDHGGRPARHVRLRRPSADAGVRDHRVHAGLGRSRAPPSTSSSSRGSWSGSHLGVGARGRGALVARRPAEHACCSSSSRVVFPLGLLAVLGHGVSSLVHARISGPIYYMPALRRRRAS